LRQSASGFTQPVAAGAGSPGAGAGAGAAAAAAGAGSALTGDGTAPLCGGAAGSAGASSIVAGSGGIVSVLFFDLLQVGWVELQVVQYPMARKRPAFHKISLILLARHEGYLVRGTETVEDRLERELLLKRISLANL
tara:strand:- start:835 stop:1245 length:411 start_codon:yes stop_codon:yes gene_type:complete